MTIQANFPTIKPSLNLDFANVRALDPRITFTNSSDDRAYFDEFGVMRKAVANVARFDHNPVTGESLGLLIEEQRTNLLTYSEQFDNAAWTKFNATITANAMTAPDGTVTMDKLVENTANNTHLTFVSFSYTSGITYTNSVYAKAAERTIFRITCPVNAGAGTARFNLTLGTAEIINGTGAIASIQNLGNGVYRCSITVTATDTASRQFSYSLNDAGGLNVYTGDGTSGLYIWGAQLEVGAFPTSYIKTEASQVTRAADSAVMTGTNFSSWYNSEEGTLYAEADTADVVGTRASFFISDGTLANRIHTNAYNATKVFIASSNVTQLSQAIPSVAFTNNVPSKVALAYSLNNGNGAANGTIGTLDTALTVPVVNQVRLGGISLINSPLNGHIRRVAYYPRRLTDAQLQALTA